jgi:hypothetical protein
MGNMDIHTSMQDVHKQKKARYNSSKLKVGVHVKKYVNRGLASMAC